MNGKPVVLRERARGDIDEAIGYYLAEAGSTVALAFVEALEDARRSIGELPPIGSLRYAHELDIPGLRDRSTGRYPYLIFYLEKETEIEIWRVLHSARDIPASMLELREI